MECPACKTENPEGANFCFGCGGKLLLTCDQCGTELPVEAMFCFKCGALVAKTDTEEVEKISPDSLTAALQRMVPQEYAERLREAGGHLSRERRLVTILFSDVKGSTAMAEELDPEDVMEIMDGAFEVLIEPVYKYEGTLARLMGDAVLAFFGAPISHEDDPERAIRAGLEIVAGAEEYAKKLKEERGVEGFNVRVGINTGLVVVGEVGSDLRVEYTAMGDAINLAARMEQNAPSGGVLITHDTFRHVRGVFDIQPQEPITVKGKSEPISTYLVERAKQRAFRMATRGVEGIETRMVGREMELKILQDALYAAAEDGEGQIITILGEAGLGKSRLLYEFTNWIDLLPQEVRLFQGRSRQDTQNQPYALLRDMFSSRFLIQDGDSAREIQQKIEVGFGELFGQDESGQMRAHFIAQLLGFDFSGSPHLKGVLEDALQLRDRSLIYLDEYFQGMSETTPTVIFLEDLHWADDSSLDAINQLARKTPHRRILILCLARPVIYERRPHWGEGLEYHHRLEIKLLTKRDSRRLVDEILQRVDQVPAQLRDLVVRGAEGNPFYIEELIKMLLEDGVIVKDEARWRVELPRLAEVDVPSTLTGVLQSRLDSLPQGERALLQQASIVGRIFWDRVLQHMVDQEADRVSSDGIDTRLSSLRGRELIFHREGSTFVGSDEYIFKHALLRDVTYESVLKRLRRVYHRLVAEWLIDQGDEFSGLIADHLEHAGDNDGALKYLREAGDQAVGRYANAEAVFYYTRALKLTPQEKLVHRYDLLLAREKVLNTLGDREKQVSDLAALREIARALGDQRRGAEAALREIIYLDETGDYQGVVDKVDTALALAQAGGDAECEAAIYLNWGRALIWQHDLEAARPPLEKALELARANRLRKLEAHSLRHFGMIKFLSFQISAGRDYTQQTLEICQEIGDRRGEALALINIGVCYRIDRDFPHAEDYFKRALRIGRAIGYHVAQTVGLINQAAIAAYQGYYDRAIDLAMQGVEICRETGAHSTECECLGWVGDFYLETGRYDRAKRSFDQALNIFSVNVNLVKQLVITRGLTEYYLALGDYGSAEKGYQLINAHIDEIKALMIKVGLRMNLGFFKHQIGQDRVALGHVAEAFSMLGESEAWESRWFGHTVSGHAHTALGDLDKALNEYEQALALRSSLLGPRKIYDTLAGMARQSLSRGDLTQALSHVEEILTHLETGNLDGSLEPYRIYLTCYQVLRANQDPRANGILADTYNLLQERGENIADESLRSSFLENVAVNREIINEYKKISNLE